MLNTSFNNTTIDSMYSLHSSKGASTTDGGRYTPDSDSLLQSATRSRIQRVAIGATVMACSVFTTGVTSARGLNQTDIGQDYFSVQAAAEPIGLESIEAFKRNL